MTVGQCCAHRTAWYLAVTRARPGSAKLVRCPAIIAFGVYCPGPPRKSLKLSIFSRSCHKTQLGSTGLRQCPKLRIIEFRDLAAFSIPPLTTNCLAVRLVTASPDEQYDASFGRSFHTHGFGYLRVEEFGRSKRLGQMERTPTMPVFSYPGPENATQCCARPNFLSNASNRSITSKDHPYPLNVPGYFS